MIKLKNILRESTRPNWYLFAQFLKNMDDTSNFDEKLNTYGKKWGLNASELKGWAKIGLKNSKNEEVKQIFNDFLAKVNKINENENSLPDVPEDIDTKTMPTGMDEILNKFPKLRETLVDLLTHDFKTFVKDIYWVAPRPTTFKIVLVNDKYFYLTWYKLTFVAQVEGKKYYLLNINEKERAIKSISDILKLGNPNKKSPNDAGLDDGISKDKKVPLPFEPELDTQAPTPNEPNDKLGLP